MFFIKYFKAYKAMKEAGLVAYCIFNRNKEWINVSSEIKAILILHYFVLPFLLFRLILSKLGLTKFDPEKSLAINAFILSSTTSSSYSEWRSAQEICDLMPQEVKENAMPKRDKKNEEIHLSFVIFFLHTVSLALGGSRPETKSEYVNGILKEEGYILATEPLEMHFDSLLNLSPLQQIHGGRDIMYLRKPIGNKRDSLPKFFTRPIEGLN